MFFDGDGDRIDIYRGDGTYLSSSFVYAAILPGDPPPVRRPGPGGLRRPQVEPPGDHRDGPDGRDRRRDPQRPFADQGEPEERPGPVRRRGGIGPLLRGVLRRTARARYCTENTLYIALLVARTWHRGSRSLRPPDRHPGDDGARARVGLQVPRATRPGPRHSMRSASISRGKGRRRWTG